MILVSIFLFVIIGLLLSRSIIYFDILNFENDKKDIKSNFNIKLKLKLFGIIPICTFYFKEDGVYIFNFKINYLKIVQNKKVKNSFSKLKNKLSLSNLYELKPNIEKLNLKLSLGTEDVIITSFLVTIFSFIITYIFKNYIKKIDMDKYSYKINPNFNEENKISLELNGVLNIKTTNIIECII